MSEFMGACVCVFVTPHPPRYSLFVVYSPLVVIDHEYKRWSIRVNDFSRLSWYLCRHVSHTDSEALFLPLSTRSQRKTCSIVRKFMPLRNANVRIHDTLRWNGRFLFCLCIFAFLWCELNTPICMIWPCHWAEYGELEQSVRAHNSRINFGPRWWRISNVRRLLFEWLFCHSCVPKTNPIFIRKCASYPDW